MFTQKFLNVGMNAVVVVYWIIIIHRYVIVDVIYRRGGESECFDVFFLL